ncbi:PhnD/SsuA/transferrin family substrate-binding protein [Mesorhizobium retamae]|uniref:PhnD/SsuA/transferrin family substrate-binding protein n=1 Tax=Mesorhizobium retamae TaxID=2912854 RepID=A0ABS9QDD0_9HYPH|nr:PhnD/SsuA/transferrin family substrate-binding protein [Mesorhizobium sp. IRAMC:0171]MCG7505428.1 PhnD/SsuA/transferrin family substrate-binding protein [Mesorhizobium sp. IRAMC:0171]
MELSFLRNIAAAIGIGLLGLAPATGIASAETIRLAATDIDGLEELQRQFGQFKQILSETTGIDIEFFPVNNRTVAGEALRSGKVDMALVGPSEYTIFQSRTRIAPVVAFSRADYYSAIIVRQDSGIHTLADLRGKRMAFAAVGSTSAHIGPSLLLAAAGLDPTKDVEPVHLSNMVGYTALKRGDVAAWGMAGFVYMRLRDEDPEVNSGTFRVIARGPDLPNDVIVAGEHVDEEVIERFREAFRNPETAAKLKEALLVTTEGADRYTLSAFLPNVQDKDYDYMRQGFVAIGQPQFSKPLN